MVAPGPRILYLQYANPAAYPPVVHGAHILAEHGAEIRMLGTRPRVAGEIVMPPHERIRLLLLGEGRGFGQKVAFVRFLASALWLAIRFRPDWLYVSDAFAAPAGLLVAAITRVPVVYHEHDVHSEPNPSSFVRLCMAARRRLARTAHAVVVPSAGRAAHLRETLGVRDALVVFNCPRRGDVRDHDDAPEGPLRLAFQGTIVPQRLPLQLADAIADLGGAVTLAVAGYEPAGAEGHMQRLIERAAAGGSPGAITYAGLITRRTELLEFCGTSDVGLALVPRDGGDVNMASMAGASNKAFDYLACGVPVLASDLEDWRELFVRPGYAVAVRPDDRAALAAALRWLVGHRAEVRAMGAAGRRRILDEWNYEHQFAPVQARLLAAQPRAATHTVASAA